MSRVRTSSPAPNNTMKKYQLTCPYVIAKFEKHQELKQQILDAINRQKEFDHLTETDDDVNISRCDWNTSRWDYNREWLQILGEDFNQHLLNQVQHMGYSWYRMKEIWFQQYNTESTHGWHVHGSNWTNVYYLDLPKDSPKTQMINPFDQTTVSEFDVEEGDILTFPSFVIHKAPVNLSKETKTIISWNMDTELNPGIYK